MNEQEKKEIIRQVVDQLLSKTPDELITAIKETHSQRIGATLVKLGVVDYLLNEEEKPLQSL